MLRLVGLLRPTGLGEAHGHVGCHTLDFQFRRGGGMRPRELYLRLDLDFSCLTGRANQDRSRAPFDGTRIGIDGGIADNGAFALYREADILLSQPADMAEVVGYLADNDYEV